MQPIDDMAEPNYWTSCDETFHQDLMMCGLTPSEFAPLFDDRFGLECDVGTSPCLTTNTTDKNTHTMPSAIHNQTEYQHDSSNLVLENSSQFSDSGNNGNSSTYTKNKFPASWHPSSSQPELVEQTPSIQSRDDQQYIPINSSRILPDSPKSESYKCIPCKRTFSCKMELHGHYHSTEHSNKLQTTSKPRQHKCTTCEKAFKFNSELQRHCKTSIKHNHAVQFGRILRLNQTQQSVVHQLKIPPTFHSNNPSSSQTKQVKQSLSKQSRDDQHKCRPCNKTFISRVELKGHYNTQEHQDQIKNQRRLYKCTTCALDFTHSWNLKKHYKTKKHLSLEAELNRLKETQQSVVHQLSIPPISNRSSHLTSFGGETTSVLINSNEQAGLNDLSQPTVFSCAQLPLSNCSIDQQSTVSSSALTLPSDQADQSNFFHAAGFSNGGQTQAILQSNYFSYSNPFDEPNTARSSELIFPNEQAVYNDFLEAAAFFSRDC